MVVGWAEMAKGRVERVIFIFLFLTAACRLESSSATACCFRLSAGIAFVGEEGSVSHRGSLDDVLMCRKLISLV